jgi:hypothetical protein
MNPCISTGTDTEPVLNAGPVVSVRQRWDPLSVVAGMLSFVAVRKSPYGRVVLISGPETLLADRAVESLLSQVRREAPEVEVNELEAVRLDGPRLAEITSASLF